MYKNMKQELDVEEYTFDAITAALEEDKAEYKTDVMRELRELIRNAQHTLYLFESEEPSFDQLFIKVEDNVRNLRGHISNYGDAKCLIDLTGTMKKDMEQEEFKPDKLLEAFQKVKDTHKDTVIQAMEKTVNLMKDSDMLDNGNETGLNLNQLGLLAQMYRSVYNMTSLIEAVQEYKVNH